VTKPIGILGGTFDPVHNGHLRLALETCETLGLEEVKLIPPGTPPHRNTPVTSARHRFRMLELGTEEVPNLTADDRELRRTGKSFTIDTLRDIRKELINDPLCLIMGMDAFQSINSWHEWSLLLDYAHIVIVDRPGTGIDLKEQEVAELYRQYATEDHRIILQDPAGSIIKIENPMLDISSSRIRNLISAHRDISYLVPEKVMAYIKQKQLYH